MDTVTVTVRGQLSQGDHDILKEPRLSENLLAERVVRMRPANRTKCCDARMA